MAAAARELASRQRIHEVIWLALLAALCCADLARPADVPHAGSIRGWTILSDSEPDALAVIEASRAYRINHLQLSHQIIEDLRQVREPKRQAFVRRLIDAAHAAGIQEVVLWDHALYDLAYYPREFRTGPNGTIDLDNPAFWAWLKADYRKLLDLAPGADGLVLTFHRDRRAGRAPANWKDVVDHLAPEWAKDRRTAPQLAEVPWVIERGWLHADDRIDEVYIDYVMREKAFGVRLTEESLRDIELARPLLEDAAYRDLRQYFERTLLTARLHRAAAGAYFGYRLYARGAPFRTAAVMKTVRESMIDLPLVAREIREYTVKPPAGQWDWAADADAAMRYYRAIE